MTEQTAILKTIDAAAKHAVRAADKIDVRVKPQFVVDQAFADNQVNDTTIKQTATHWGIVGWDPRAGLVPHFGQAKVGKSTGIATMIIHKAAVDSVSVPRPTTWMTKDIVRYGHVVWYSGEETRDAIQQRFAKLIRAMGYAQADVLAILRRILVIAPISMSAEQWPARNAILMSKLGYDEGGEWAPNASHNWLWSQVATWNAEVEARGGPDEDRIITMVVDSVTSCAGFASTEETAIQNFLFHLNRQAILNDISVIPIAHTPKSTSILWNDPHMDALARMKGNGSWSALSRLIVEWRRPEGQGFDGRSKKVQQSWYETKELYDTGILKNSRARRDMLIAQVAEGNVDYDNRKIWLKRDDDGCLVDLTAKLAHVSNSLAEYSEKNGGKDANGQPLMRSEAEVEAAARKDARKCIFTVLSEMAIKHGKPVTAAALKIALNDETTRKRFPVLSSKRTPAKGGLSLEGNRTNSVAWELRQMSEFDGPLMKVTGGFKPRPTDEEEDA